MFKLKVGKVSNTEAHVCESHPGEWKAQAQFFLVVSQEKVGL